MKILLAAALTLASAGAAHAQGRVKAARELAELLIGRFGAKAGRTVPELAGRIERLAVTHGDDAVRALGRGGPEAVALVEAAGPNGAKALRVLAAHGELGASRVLARPAAMRHFLKHGDDAAAALVRHPGVAEPLIDRGGAAAVKALGAVDPRNGRRLAMLADGELAGAAARHPEVMGVVARHGNRAAEFLWENKATLAGGAALAAFLADPEPFLDGTRNLAAAAGEGVVKPVVSGLTTVLLGVLAVAGLVVVGAAAVLRKHGPPSADGVRVVAGLFKR